MATLASDPGQRHLFMVNTRNKNVTCLTKTQQKDENGRGELVNCEYSQIHISQNKDAYVQVRKLEGIRGYPIVRVL